MTSSAHLQREADAHRVELADTLNRLRDGLAPSALSMGAMALARNGGLSLVKSLADQARANPVSALLIGAGLTMLLTRTSGADVLGAAGSTLRSGAQAARSAASSVASTASATAAETSDRARAAAADRADRLRERASQTYDAARQKVEDGIESGRRTLQDTRDEAATRARELADKAREAANVAREKAALLGEQTRQSAAHLIEEQPILVAALAAALGAAVGAALPLSRTEKDMIGAVGQRAVGGGREAMARAADVVQQEVAQSDIGGKVGDIADKVVQGIAGEPEQKAPGQTG